MTTRNLEAVLHPRSVAVFGASTREGSVGRVVIDNIVKGGFEGPIWPLNPKYRQVAGLACYRGAADLPGAPDLAVIVTPPQTVPGIVEELGAKGTRAAVVITAGLTESNGLRQRMLDAARPNLFRIVGPNTVGLMIPPAKLNAGFAHIAAQPGNIALLSQSGAIATSLIDWAAANNVGFSYIVSLGDMADVDVGDWLDLLATDHGTQAIVMYLESIPNPRKFISAARAASRLKPVIAIKAGRHQLAARAAATHTGALAGADRVIDAALQRSGILRVNGLSELFDAAEITARFHALERSNVGIVTNGGGAGVLAVDHLGDRGAWLAELQPATIDRLNAALPPTWSHANPVDIIGDAPAARYVEAVKAVAADPGCDAILVLNCPTGLASPTGTAEAIAGLAERGKIENKPLLTCWLGEHTAQAGRQILHQAGVPSFETPSDAVAALSYLAGWSRAQRALARVPSSRSEDVGGDRRAVLSIFRYVAKDGRRMLTEPEAKAAIAAYGIPVPQTIVAHDRTAVGRAASELLQQEERVVVKLLSKTISHKLDVGGVVLDISTEAEAEAAADGIAEKVATAAPDAVIEGYAVQAMVRRRGAQELILGMHRDPGFGPVILFGAGGVAVEVVDDTAIALPPMDDILAGDLIDRTRIGRLLAGFRDRKPADRKAIIAALNGLSQMVVDFPCVVSVDVNPLLADANGIIALDARIEIDPAQVEAPAPNAALAIRPYPADWEKEIVAGGSSYRVRPIKPADIKLYPGFLAKVSQEDMRLRFLLPVRTLPETVLKRLTQLDYEREMAFVAIEPTGELAGVARLSAVPDRSEAEYALLVRTDLQGHGLGRSLLSLVIDYGRAEGLGRIRGIVLRENRKMLDMCRELGFSAAADTDEPRNMLVSLAL